MDWKIFLKDYGGHILALIALMQVWVIAVCKRIFGRGKLTIYETANIEIGFSDFGATIALVGTLRAEKQDVFVERMQIRVIRVRDKAQHVFTWRVFRPLSMNVTGRAYSSLEVASSFLVTDEQSHRYHVFFGSADFTGQHGPFVQPLRDAWNLFLEQHAQKSGENAAQVLERPGLAAQLFSNFVESGHARDFQTSVSNDFFWHAGDYILEFYIDNNGSRSPLVRNWRFSLTQDDEAVLRLNIVTVLRELCNLPINYNFLYKNYRSTKTASGTAGNR